MRTMQKICSSTPAGMKPSTLYSVHSAPVCSATSPSTLKRGQAMPSSLGERRLRSHAISTILNEWNQTLAGNWSRYYRRPRRSSQRPTTPAGLHAPAGRCISPTATCSIFSRAACLPDRDEAVLQRAVELVDQLIERCIGGLDTLDDKLRRWLRSARQREPGRPAVRAAAKSREPGCICRVYATASLYTIYQSCRERDGASTASTKSAEDGAEGDCGGGRLAR